MRILGKNVLVKKITEKTTVGGIHLPDINNNKNLKYIVAERGDEVTHVEIGDEVMFNSKTIHYFSNKTGDYAILPQEDILAVV